MDRYLDIAYKNTKHSTHRHQNMACVVVRGGAILSVEANSNQWVGHCEARALRPNMDFSGSTLIVVRSNKKCSKPCAKCMVKIREAGVKKIVYVDSDDNVTVEKVR